MVHVKRGQAIAERDGSLPSPGWVPRPSGNRSPEYRDGRVAKSAPTRVQRSLLITNHEAMDAKTPVGRHYQLEAGFHNGGFGLTHDVPRTLACLGFALAVLCLRHGMFRHVTSALDRFQAHAPNEPYN
jgi:hypothetical protein